MKAPFSAYLSGIKPGLRKLLGLLGPDYDYVSVLSTDSAGFQLSISQHSKSVSNAKSLKDKKKNEKKKKSRKDSRKNESNEKKKNKKDYKGKNKNESRKKN